MKNLRFLGLLAVVSVLVLAGTATAQNEIRKGELNEKIVKQILKLPYYDVFDSIKFSESDGTVTLMGSVMQPSTKENAEDRVKEIDGVKEVINNIEVLPLSRFDDTIRYRTWRSIANKGTLYRYLIGVNPPMRIIVNDGRVSLEGFVNNEVDSNLAYIAAREVPGTFGVENNLIVKRDL